MKELINKISLELRDKRYKGRYNVYLNKTPDEPEEIGYVDINPQGFSVFLYYGDFETYEKKFIRSESLSEEQITERALTESKAYICRYIKAYIMKN